MWKICRVCLTTDEPLQKLDESLTDYFQDLCDYTSGFAKHLCCPDCEVSLKKNLDFRNKCLKSNKIWQQWRKNKDKTKGPIQSLHILLQTSLKDTTEINKTTDIKVNDTETQNNDVKDNGNNENNGTVKREIKEEAEEIDNHGEDNECVNGNNNDNDIGDNGTVNVVANDNLYDECNTSDDDKFLIDCVQNKALAKGSRKVPKKRHYQRKGLSEYAQYASVFDIQLFKTDDDARRELAQRKFSEPYLSAKHRCEVCYTVYKAEKLLDFHMKWHEPTPYECDICRMTFHSPKPHVTHKAKCHRGKFSCKLCPVVTYYGSAMKAHFQKHQGKQYTCHCGRVFHHISSYLSHKRTVHTSTHVCVTCARTFVSELGLANHRVRAHKDNSTEDVENSVRCEPCNLTFANRNVYNIHILNTEQHTDLAKDIIACVYCGVPFPNVAQLREHKRHLHPKKKDTNLVINCTLCVASGVGRMWRRRHYLSEHPTVPYSDVSEARRHLCHHCGKHFCNVTSLKDHINIHTGAKPYVCGQCHAAFDSYTKRAIHAEKHAPPKRVCHHCGNKFRSASNLAVHMRIHTGIKKHICSVCSKGFLHRAACREHERSVHRHIRRVRKSNTTV